MEINTLLDIMAVFVAAATIAVAIQAVLLYRIHASVHSLRVTAERIAPKVEALVDATTEAIHDSRREIQEVAAKTKQILEIAHAEEVRVVDLVEDVVSRVRYERYRAEVAIDNTLGRVKHTADKIQSGVMKPVRGLQGLAAGVKIAMLYLLRDHHHDVNGRARRDRSAA